MIDRAISRYNLLIDGTAGDSNDTDDFFCHASAFIADSHRIGSNLLTWTLERDRLRGYKNQARLARLKVANNHWGGDGHNQRDCCTDAQTGPVQP